MNDKIKDRIKKWVMEDGIVKRANKLSIERAIDLTIEKALPLYIEILKEGSHNGKI